MLLAKGEKLSETWQNSCVYFEDGTAKVFDFSNTKVWHRPEKGEFVEFDLYRSGPFEYATNPSVPLADPGWGDRQLNASRGTGGEDNNGSFHVSSETGEIGRSERIVFEDGVAVHYETFCDEKGTRPELTNLWADGPKPAKRGSDKETFHYNSQRGEATLFGIYKSPFSDWEPHQVYATFKTDGKIGTLSSLRYAGSELVGETEERNASLRKDIVSKFLGIGEEGKIDLYLTCVNFAENRQEAHSSAQSALAKYFAVA